MLKFPCLFAALLLSFSALASWEVLYKEFLQRNSILKINQAKLEQSNIDLESFYGMYDFVVSGSYSYMNDQKDVLSPFQPRGTINDTATLNLARQFSWGGSLEFVNSLSHNDISNWNPALRNGRPNDIYTFSQTLSYSQDLGKNFLGKATQAQEDSSLAKQKLAEVSLTIENQQKVFEFYQAYLNVKLQKTLMKLQEEALLRSEKRRDLISRRVRDGLREKVDLYQAEIGLKTQQEALQSTKATLVESLTSLGILLEREVSIEEIPIFTRQERIALEEQPQLFENNLDLKQLQKQVDFLEAQLEKTKWDRMPDLSLRVSYTTNEIDSQQSKALSDGTLGGQNDEKVIAVNWSYPLENTMSRSAHNKNRVEKRILSYQRKVLENRLKLRSNEVHQKIVSHFNNIQLAREKVRFAEKAIKGLSRLYSLGKADLDRVIGAEEQLITTQNNLARSMMSYRVLEATEKKLEGTLLEQMMQERDQ